MQQVKQLLAGLSKRQWLIAAACAAGLAFAVSGIYSITPQEGNAPAAVARTGAGSEAEPGSKVTRALATGAMAAFVIGTERRELPDLQFRDETGAARSISDWRGRVVLLNLWATWCAPCRKEMPDLAALQRELGGADFEVVAVSVDRKGAEASAQFLIDNDAASLKLYIDRSAEVLDRIKAIGLPATVLIDRTGMEIGRLVGPADWSSEDAVRLIEAALAEGRVPQAAGN